MTVTSVRPDASDLAFHVFGRSVHPELFETYAQACVSHTKYAAQLRICDSGHWITLHLDQQILSEVVVSQHQTLPNQGRFLQKRLRGHQCRTFHFENGVTYHASFQLERLSPEVYLNLHEELLQDCSRAQLAHRFPGSSRLAPNPLSLVLAEANHDCLLVHTFHTFPENCAIVKTQSLFELDCVV